MGPKIPGTAITSFIAQYPDTKLMKAVKLLKPEERPKAPVRVVDPDPKKYPLFARVKSIEGTFDPNGATGNTGRPTIVINSAGRGYNEDDPTRLAATMIHENEHINRKDYEEAPAYAKQYEFLKRIGYKDKSYLDGIFNRSTQPIAQKEQK